MLVFPILGAPCGPPLRDPRTLLSVFFFLMSALGENGMVFSFSFFAVFWGFGSTLVSFFVVFVTLWPSSLLRLWGWQQRFQVDCRCSCSTLPLLGAQRGSFLFCPNVWQHLRGNGLIQLGMFLNCWWLYIYIPFRWMTSNDASTPFFFPGNHGGGTGQWRQGQNRHIVLKGSENRDFRQGCQLSTPLRTPKWFAASLLECVWSWHPKCLGQTLIISYHIISACFCRAVGCSMFIAGMVVLFLMQTRGHQDLKENVPRPVPKMTDEIDRSQPGTPRPRCFGQLFVSGGCVGSL